MDSTARPTVFTIHNAEPVPFELNSVGDSNIANLRRTADLDFDTGPDHYELEISCSDLSGITTSAVITVTVLPENEYLPQFTLEPSPITIKEVTEPGTVLASQGDGGLARITVSDGDRGEDGVLRFLFPATTDDAIELTHFDINATDGTITLTQAIDVDVDFITNVDLEVIICDGSRSQIKCPIKVVVVVIMSVNEFAPQFSHLSYTTIQTEYSEGEYNEVVATVTCTDMDMYEGEFGSIHLQESLVMVPLKLVELSNGQAKLFLNGSLDYELIRAPQVEAELICYDTGSPESPIKNTTATVTLLVRGIDDNLPQFSQAVYEFEVPETQKVGSEVLSVACTDLDYGVGSLAEIQLFNASSEVSKTFSVEPKTGLISLAKSLDYDAGSQSYKFSVVCTDTAGNIDTASVYLTVLPVNDERVQFRKSEYEFRLNRLELPGHVLGMVEIDDGDIDPEQVISYSIEDNPHFRIDSEGEVVLKQFILFLQGDHFRLSVGASDGANEEVSATIIVSVVGPLSVLDIVLIIIGVLVLLGIFIIIICCCCVARCRKKKG